MLPVKRPISRFVMWHERGRRENLSYSLEPMVAARIAQRRGAYAPIVPYNALSSISCLPEQ